MVDRNSSGRRWRRAPAVAQQGTPNSRIPPQQRVAPGAATLLTRAGQTWRILLVMPKTPARYEHGSMPPLGLLSLAAVARQMGADIRVVDEDVCSRGTTLALLNDWQPHIVGIGGTSHQRFESFAVAAASKCLCPQAITVYGGPHATFTSEDILANVPAVDVVVRGEGEETFRDMLFTLGADADLGGVAGLSLRTNGSVVHTGQRLPIHDLDRLPPPARDLAQVCRYPLRDAPTGLRSMHVMTARGCPIGCAFCSASAMWGKPYRRRSPEAVVDEIAQLVQQHNLTGVKIFDSTFTLDRRHVLAFCEALKRRCPGIQWQCESRFDTVDRDLLRAMKDAGCVFMQYGMESASQRVLDFIGKRITVEQAEQVLAWHRELGIRCQVFFTFGHPTEDWSDVEKTLAFLSAKAHLIDRVVAGVGIMIYPGTKVEHFARTHALLPDGFSWSQPYRCEHNEVLGCDPVVPILVQPQLGWQELFHIRRRVLSWRVSNMRSLRRRLREIGSPADFLASVRSLARPFLHRKAAH